MDSYRRLRSGIPSVRCAIPVRKRDHMWPFASRHRHCITRIMAATVAMLWTLTGFGCGQSTKVSPIDGARVLFATGSIALVHGRFHSTSESLFLATLVHDGVLSGDSNGPVLQSPVILRSDPVGRAVMIRLPRQQPSRPVDHGHEVVIWPCFQHPERYVKLGPCKEVLYFSGSVVILDQQSSLRAVDLVDGSTRVLPAGSEGVVNELPGNRMVLRRIDASACIWNWRTGEIRELNLNDIIGAIDLPGGLCTVVANMQLPVETWLTTEHGTIHIDAVQGVMRHNVPMPYIVIEMLRTRVPWIYRVGADAKMLPVGSASSAGFYPGDIASISPDGNMAVVSRGTFPTLINFSVISIKPCSFGVELARLPSDIAFRIGYDELVWLSTDSTGSDPVPAHR